MSSGAIKRKTANFGLNIINYDFPRWHTFDWQNWETLEAVLSAAGLTAVRGIWENNTAYSVGDRVVDNASSSIWICSVAHTSAISGTFGDDRLAHPTYWRAISSVPVNRGNWITAVVYNTWDIVKFGNAYYTATVLHTSGVFATDLADGKWALIIDLQDALDAETNAAASAASAATSAAEAIATTTAQINARLADETTPDTDDEKFSTPEDVVRRIPDAGLPSPYSQPFGAPAPNIRQQQKDKLYLKDIDSRVGTNSPEIDTAAIKKMQEVSEQDSDWRGREMRLSYGNPLRIGEPLIFTANPNGLHNFTMRGEHRTASRLDFSDCPPDTEVALWIKKGTQFCLSDFDIANAPQHGLLVGEGTPFESDDIFSHEFDISRLRVQYCGGDGIRFVNTFEHNVSRIETIGNGGAGLNFVGGHTSVTMLGGWARLNAGAGYKLNGMVYSKLIGMGSDHNIVGYECSNLQGFGFSECGSESNVQDGWLFKSGVETSGLPSDYQDLSVGMEGCFAFNNRTGGGSFANLLRAVSAGSRPIDIRLKGPRATPIAFVNDVILDGASGLIRLFEEMLSSTYSISRSGSTDRRNADVSSRVAEAQLSSVQSIANNTQTTISWNTLGTNETGSSLADSGQSLVVGPQISRVKVKAGIRFTEGGVGIRSVFLYKNGSLIDRYEIHSSGLGDDYLPIETPPMDVVSTDRFRVDVYQNQGSAVNVKHGVNTYIRFEACY